MCKITRSSRSVQLAPWKAPRKKRPPRANHRLAALAAFSASRAALSGLKRTGRQLTRLNLSRREPGRASRVEDPGKPVGLQSKRQARDRHGKRQQIQADVRPLADLIEEGAAGGSPLRTLHAPAHKEADRQKHKHGDTENHVNSQDRYSGKGRRHPARAPLLLRTLGEQCGDKDQGSDRPMQDYKAGMVASNGRGSPWLWGH